MNGTRKGRQMKNTFHCNSVFRKEGEAKKKEIIGRTSIIHINTKKINKEKLTVISLLFLADPLEVFTVAFL